MCEYVFGNKSLKLAGMLFIPMEVLLKRAPPPKKKNKIKNTKLQLVELFGFPEIMCFVFLYCQELYYVNLFVDLK